ncbi:MAG: alpha/beta hydrolase [Aestuariivirga sp.]
MELSWPLNHPETLADGGTFFRDVVFAAPWGFRPLMLDVRLPKGDGPFPLIVFVHGGAWATNGPTITNKIYRKMDMFNRFAAAGFAVARISYRLTNEAQFPNQLYDCKSAIRFLRKHAELLRIDPKRFAAFGDSAGGHLVAMLGLTGNNPELEGKIGTTEGSSAVSCVINWFGPTDIITLGEDKRELGNAWGDSDLADSPESMLLGGAPPLNLEKAKAASPITYVHKNAPPMLMQYGDADRLVPLVQGEALYNALKAVGVDVTLQIIKDADHCFWGVENHYIIDNDIAFLKKHLG